MAMGGWAGGLADGRMGGRAVRTEVGGRADHGAAKKLRFS